MPYDPYFSPSSILTNLCRLLMMLVEPASSSKDIEEKRLYDVALLPGADGSSAFLFSLHFHYTEASPVAWGQPRDR
jgi:hypothetical protein